MRDLSRGLLVAIATVLVVATMVSADEAWTKTYVSGLESLAYDVLLLDDGGFLLVGGTVVQHEPVMIGNLLLIRLDAGGDVIWERTYGADRFCSGQSALVARDGSYVIAGTIQSETGSDLDIYLLHVAEDGTELRSRSFGSPLDEFGGTLLPSIDGGYVIVGDAVDPNDVVADPGAAGYAGFAGRSSPYIVKVDQAWNELWSCRYDNGENVIIGGGAIAADGGIVVLSYAMYYPVDDNDICLFKLDANGEEVWSRRWEEGKSSGYDLLATRDGGYLISDMHVFPDDPQREKPDALLIKVDGDGRELWLSTVGTPGNVDTALAVTETHDGQYVCVGWRTQSFYTRKDDIYLAGFNIEGSLLWESVIPSAKHNMHEAIVQHDDGSLIIGSSSAQSGRPFRIQLIKTAWPGVAASGTGADAQDARDETETKAISGFSGEYLGQTPPGDVAVRFASGSLLATGTEWWVSAPAFSACGDVMIWTRYSVGDPDCKDLLCMTRQADGRWTIPEVVPFGSEQDDMHAAFKPGTDTLLVLSGRPGGPLFEIERSEEGWTDPVSIAIPLPYPIGHQIAIARSGTAYFRMTNDGNMDLYQATWIYGQYASPASLGTAINTDHYEYGPCVSPDETFILFASNRPGGYGNKDLHVSFRNADGSWGDPVNLGSSVNTADTETLPALSPDGAYLFFLSRRSGDTMYNPYWVCADVIERARPHGESDAGS